MHELPHFQAYPKMLYRLCDGSETLDVLVVEGRKIKYTIVQSIDEHRKARGWHETPTEALKRKKVRYWAQTAMKSWWEKWEWSMKFTAALLVIFAATAKLFEAIFGK
jgi:hypothetical protein